MKKCIRSSRFRRSRSAISLSIIAALLWTIEIPAAAFGVRTLQRSQTESRTASGDISLSWATATVSENRVLLRWRTSYEIDNLGFNIYRLKAGEHARVNREIIPGSIFIVGEKTPLRAGYSYSFFDHGGTADSTYYIESVSPVGTLKQFGPLRTVAGGKLFEGSPNVSAERTSDQSGGSPSISFPQREYPASENIRAVASGLIEEQWAIAAQPGLKIFIKKDGWYRVTQQQMVAAGFNPTVDIRNLLLYVDSQELAIRTSKSRGQFSSGDYFEFYGRGLDTPTTDIRTYYLIAGSIAGKRVRGEIQLDTSEELPPSVPQSTPPSRLFFRPGLISFGLLFGFLNGLDQPVGDAIKSRNKVSALAKSGGKLSNPLMSDAKFPDIPNSETKVSDPVDSATETTAPAKGEPTVNSQPESQPIVAAVSRKKQSKRKAAKRKKITRREHNHAASVAAAPSFDFTVERKDRLLYFANLLNGDEENFFGPVINSSPLMETLTTLNPEPTAPGPARLEVALQGVSLVTHEVNVFLNDIAVGTMTYDGRDRKVQTMDIPVSVLHDGVNTLKFVCEITSGTSLLDYARLTYPHAYRADNNSLRFSLRSVQSATIDGFSTQNLNLIDYTDPFSVKVIRPITAVSGSGYAFTVPASAVRSKFPRVLYVVPEGQPEQPAGFAFNQPSTLNQSSNGADVVIIAHKNLLQSVATLADLRRSQGLTVSVVDVEDVYDEFDFGVHGPRSIRDFLARAKSSWTRVPRYVILAGDASLDPRNYQGDGDLDFVPTKLVDASYNETASDDWLTDFDNDGIADIPVGRLPASSASQANLMISKIVNFAAANVPQSALLVADTQGDYYFNFEAANDAVQLLISSSLTPVYRVNRRTEPSDAAARANIIAKINQGQALINYTGHGNIDIWTGASIFTSADALALTNGNKLPFVVIMDCLNGYFQDPRTESIAESLLKAPYGGAVAVFASSGLTIPDGPHQMSTQLYTLLYGSQSPPLGDAIKIAKLATTDIDARRTWIFFGDPSMKIR